MNITSLIGITTAGRIETLVPFGKEHQTISQTIKDIRRANGKYNGEHYAQIFTCGNKVKSHSFSFAPIYEVCLLYTSDAADE